VVKGLKWFFCNNIVHDFVDRKGCLEYLADARLEEERFTRFAAERGAEYQRQSAVNAQYTAELSEDSLRANERAATFAAANLAATLWLAHDIDRINNN